MKNIGRVISHPLATIVLVILLLSLVYWPYVRSGGFIVDDWGQLASYYHQPHFWPLLSGYLTKSSATMRPVQAILLSVALFLYRFQPAFYIFTNLSFWFLSLFLAASVFSKIFGKNVALFFILLAAVPVLSSTTLFSPITLLSATFSYLLWSVSFWLLYRFLRQKKSVLFFISCLFLLLSLLNYEIVLPLTVLNLGLPYIMAGRNFDLKRYIKNILLPILLVFLLVVIYQKLVVPLFAVSYSRIGWPRSLTEVAGTTFLLPYSFLAGLPFLLISSLDRFSPEGLMAGLILAALVMKQTATSGRHVIFSKRRVSFILILSFGACLVMFLFSRYMPTIFGYGNRTLSSAYFLFSLSLAFVGDYLVRKKWFYLPLLFLVLLYNAQLAIRDNYRDSWSLQKKILANFVQVKEEKHLSAGTVILGNVPLYTRNNLINAEVFSQPWDFGAALLITTGGKVREGAPFTAKKVTDGEIVVKGEKIILDGWWEMPINRLWYYRYEERSYGVPAAFEIVKVADSSHLNEILRQVRKNSTNQPTYHLLMAKFLRIYDDRERYKLIFRKLLPLSPKSQ